MSIIKSVFVTISCDGPSCDKTVTFEEAKQQETIEANPWIKTLRLIQRTSDGRNFSYHSDECELAAVAEGRHNPEPEKKIISTPVNSNLIAQAAEAARLKEEATRKLKDGQPVTLHQG
jgi:hypothetical protein